MIRLCNLKETIFVQAKRIHGLGLWLCVLGALGVFPPVVFSNVEYFGIDTSRPESPYYQIQRERREAIQRQLATLDTKRKTVLELKVKKELCQWQWYRNRPLFTYCAEIPEFQTKINWQKELGVAFALQREAFKSACYQWLGRDDLKYTYCKSHICTCHETAEYPTCLPGQVDFVTEQVCSISQDPALSTEVAGMLDHESSAQFVERSDLDVSFEDDDFFAGAFKAFEQDFVKEVSQTFFGDAEVLFNHSSIGLDAVGENETGVSLTSQQQDMLDKTYDTIANRFFEEFEKEFLAEPY